MESDSQVVSSTNVVSDEDTFKILVATDIHLGYKERDIIRGDDTFKTFEEILIEAQRNEVDFILLGGDLFHETRPSPYCLNKCIELLRKYCMGDRPVQVECLSDQTHNFSRLWNQTINYEDPNINISIPVFSIHGNHDDPTGVRMMSALDLISTTGLINYFGRTDDLRNVQIEPILLQKGESQLALYGLSYIVDNRLGRLFLDKKVTWLTPEEKDGSFFNLLVWHQNRAARGHKNFIPPNVIPQFLDLVIWGHEHDCRIVPERQANGVHISQPGSPVATSLAQGEAITKHIGLLKIHKQSFDMKPIELKSVRPFVFDDLLLQAPAHSTVNKIVAEAMKKVEAKLERMIQDAENLGRIPRDFLPLIRLRITTHNENQVFNTIKYGQRYVGRVANPEDILLFTKVKSRRQRVDVTMAEEDDDLMAGVTGVTDLILKNSQGNNLSILSAEALTEAVKKFIDSQNSDAIKAVIDQQSKKVLEEVNRLAPDEDHMLECIEQLKLARIERNGDVTDAINVLKDLGGKNRTKTSLTSTEDDGDDVSIIDAPAGSTSRGGRGSRATRTPRGRGARGGGRGKKQTSVVDDENDVMVIDDDDDDDASSNVSSSRPARGRGSKGGRRKAAPKTGIYS